MICPSCQGRKGYLIGPNDPADWRTCGTCFGFGSVKPGVRPNFGTVPEFVPERHGVEPAVTSCVSRPIAPTNLASMLEEIDRTVEVSRDHHIKALAAAHYKGVRVIADHRIQDGVFAVLVSPGDYARFKQESKDGPI